MKNILVIGDLILDKYIEGSARAISQEAPVPIFKIEKEYFRLGGACNVANNLIALECSVSLYGVIGSDREGEILESMLQEKAIDFKCFKSNRPTTTKTRIISSKHQMIRIDNENDQIVEKDILSNMFNEIKDNIKKYDCIVLSDYLKGVLSAKFCKDLINLANENEKFILCDPKGKDYSKYKFSTLLTPNKLEASIATNIEIINDKTLKEALLKMRESYKVRYPLITLSEEGIAFLRKDKLVKKPTIAKEVYDVSGAGDTVIASIAMQLSLKKNIDDAATFANIAAAIVVGKVGSAVATLSEINDFINKSHFEIEKKIFNDFYSFEEILKNLESKKIIFTNGCFDILHTGHVKYLQKARMMGDVLIVGLNSNSSVMRLKGSTRPINDEMDRALILASLSSVDFVVIFKEETPLNLIKNIKPDVLVKGADYEGKEVIGSEYAKEVRLINVIEGKSSTNVIKKILDSKGE